MTYGATPEEWAHFDLLLGLGESLLPVVSNPNAQISSKSTIQKIGQIPTIYNASHHVAGITKWTEHKTSPVEIALWSQQPDYGICIQTRAVRAFDCDLPNPEIAQQIYAFLDQNLPVKLPLRGRENSSKFLLAFRFKKSPLGKRIIKIDKENKIEFLADGQQFIAIGTHPSGVKYQWANGLPPDIPELDEETFETLWKNLKTFGVKENEAGNSTEYRPRNTLGGVTETLEDPILQYLGQNSSILGFGTEGQAYVSCPFKANHTKQGDKTETVYFPAGGRGYQEGHWSCLHASCATRTDADFNHAIGYTASFFEDLGPLPVDATQHKRFEVLSLNDFLKLPPISWLVKGILPAQCLTMTFGGSGDGKTFVVIDMCMAIVRGIEWNGRRVKKGRVVYVCAEGTGDFINRIKAYCCHNNIDMASISNSFGVITDVPNFRTETDAKLLAQRIKDWGPSDLIVIDTLLETVTGADENSSKDMSVAIRCSKIIHKLCGGTVHLIHHAGKDEDRGARGWSGLKGPLDAQFQVYREAERRVFWIAKEKAARDNFGWSFDLITIPLGMDNDGDIVDSLCVRWVGETRAKVKKDKPLGDIEKLVMDLYEENGSFKVKEEEIYEEIKRRLPRGDSKRDRRVEYAGRAIQTLYGRGMLEISDGFIFDPGRNLTGTKG